MKSRSLKFMSWGLCEKCFIRIVEKDEWRIDTIVKMAKLRLDKINRCGSDEEVSFIVEDYYEVIKELLIAYMLRGGLRSKNHQCLISYFLRENPEFEREAQIVLQMSYFRNRMGYYGEMVPKSFFYSHEREFKDIVGLLLGLLEVKK